MKEKRKPRAVIFSAQGKDTFDQKQQGNLEANLDLHYYCVAGGMKWEEVVSCAREAEIIGLTRRLSKELSEEKLTPLTSLQGLALYSTGYEWVDTAYLEKRGIEWNYLKDYSAVSVAEHTLGMLLMLSRRLLLSYPMAEGWLPRGISLRGFELRGKTAGVLGMGEIGSRVAELLQAFGMRVVYYDRDPSRQGLGKAVTKDELFQHSDVVILCIPQERGFQYFVDKDELELMKPGSVLINPARAGLVNHEVLLDYIRAKKLYGYAVDDNLEILKKPAGIEPGRILQTGHTAWYSDEALEKGTEGWVENILSLARGIRARFS